MMLEACLARKEGGDVKIPFHRAPVRGPDVESHRQAVRDVFDASEGVEYRSEHVDSFIIAFLQREVERDRGGRDAFVPSEAVGTDHPCQHRPGTRHVLQAVNLDLQVVGLHDGGSIGLYHMHPLVKRNHFPFVTGHHQVVRLVDDGVLFTGTSQETLPDGGSYLVGVCLDGFESLVIANQDSVSKL